MNQNEGREAFLRRKPIRLPGFDYASPGSYFLTLCTMDRKPILWNEQTMGKDNQDMNAAGELPGFNHLLSDIGRIVLEEMDRMAEHDPVLEIVHYSIMPDHLHLILTILTDENGMPQATASVTQHVRMFKRAVNRRAGQDIWQRSYFDHIIRNEKEYAEIAEYILRNPLAWRIGENAECRMLNARFVR